MNPLLAPAWRGVLAGLVVLLLAGAAMTRVYATSTGKRLDGFSGEAPRGVLLDSLDGRSVDLADHLGRVVLVHFFATWCEPCRPELASLDRLKRETGPRGLDVLAISVAEPEMRLRRFFTDQPVAFAVLLDRDRSAARAWAVEALPSTVVVDRRGVPRLAVRGDLDWQRTDVREALARLLAEDEPSRTGGNAK